MINGGDEILGAAESERAMADGLDLVVSSVDGVFGDTVIGGRAYPFLQVVAVLTS